MGGSRTLDNAERRRGVWFRSGGLNIGAGETGERWISVAAVCHEDDQPTGLSSGIGSPNGRIGIGRPL